jgi:hypothetical protein
MLAAGWKRQQGRYAKADTKTQARVDARAFVLFCVRKSSGSPGLVTPIKGKGSQTETGLAGLYKSFTQKRDQSRDFIELS